MAQTVDSDEDELGFRVISSISDDEDDPRLCFNSEKFDPLFALSALSVKVPRPKAKVFDNLDNYKANIDRKEPRQKKKLNKDEEVAKVIQLRKWLPHQLPVQRIRKPRKNVFVRMERMQGPLALLNECIKKRLKIRICTRSEVRIRGSCTGYLTLYDKHWNLALEQVTEEWTRKKKKKIPSVDGAKSLRRYNFPVRAPQVKVTPHETNKQLENCSRFVKQIMLRGEHIVFIQVFRDESEEVTGTSERATEKFENATEKSEVTPMATDSSDEELDGSWKDNPKKEDKSERATEKSKETAMAVDSSDEELVESEAIKKSKQTAMTMDSSHEDSDDSSKAKKVDMSDDSSDEELVESEAIKKNKPTAMAVDSSDEESDDSLKLNSKKVDISIYMTMDSSHEDSDDSSKVKKVDMSEDSSDEEFGDSIKVNPKDDKSEAKETATFSSTEDSSSSDTEN